MIALLRGINVGRAKRVAMADLRALMEELGYRDVRTLLNSGNVVFTASSRSKADPAQRIEAALIKKLGVTSRVTILTDAELGDIVKRNPLLEIASDPSRLLIAIPRDMAGHALFKPLTKEKWSPDALAVGKRVAYLWCQTGLLDSRLAESVGRALGDGVTTRNWSTILKLHALAERAQEA